MTMPEPRRSAEKSRKRRGIEQSNFHDYQFLRIKDAPDIQVHLLPGDGSPAMVLEKQAYRPPRRRSNAIFAATGKRMRRLPILKVA